MRHMLRSTECLDWLRKCVTGWLLPCCTVLSAVACCRLRSGWRVVALPSFVGSLLCFRSLVRLFMSIGRGSTIPSGPVLSDLRVDEDDIFGRGMAGCPWVLFASPLLWMESKNSPGPLGSLAGGAGRQCSLLRWAAYRVAALAFFPALLGHAAHWL